MNEHEYITHTLAAALSAELRQLAADLTALLGLPPADLTTRLATRPVLGPAFAALVGQTLDVVWQALKVVADTAGTLQQNTISGGYIERIFGTAIAIQLPPAPRTIDAVQELPAAPLRDAISAVAPLPDLPRMPLVRNPLLFIGRAEDKRALTRVLTGEGVAVAIDQVGEEARAATDAILDDKSRARALGVLASCLIAAQHPSATATFADAHNAAYAILNKEERIEALGDLAKALAQTGLLHQMVALLTDLWRRAQTRDELLSLFVVPPELLRAYPDLGQQFLDSFAWVDAQLAVG